MLRGCLVMLAALAGAYYLELRALRGIGMPYAGAIAAVLSIGVALVAGSVLELVFPSGPKANRGSMVDGELVSVSGRLSAAGPAVVAPLSGRGVLMYSYEMSTITRNEQVPSKMWGGGQGAIHLVGPVGTLRLYGMPNLEHFKKDTLDGDSHLEKIAKRLGERPWRTLTGLNKSDLTNPLGDLGIEGGQADLMNPVAESQLRHAPGEMLDKLRRYRWRMEETVVPAGSEVTVKGTYHANPPSIDISWGLMKVSHEMRPGSAAQVDSQKSRSIWIGTLVLLVLAVAAHWVFYSADGKNLEGFLKGIQVERD